MNGAITDGEAIRLLLTLRRQVFAEFKVWVSIDDKEAYQVLCQQGAQSAKSYVRQLAEQLRHWHHQVALSAEPEGLVNSRTTFTESLRETDAPSVAGGGVIAANSSKWFTRPGTEPTTRPVTQPVTATPKPRYYRGVLMPAEPVTPATAKAPIQTPMNSGSPPAVSPVTEPLSQRVYRGQVVKK